MPLVVLCGYPASGKTTRALELKRYLEAFLKDRLVVVVSTTHPPSSSVADPFKIRPDVILINDESLTIKRNESYSNADEEKKARGAMISAVERHLTKEDVVICDGMNYIKGFRYQLYCITRAIGTPHCVVQCSLPVDTARKWNTQKEGDSYSETLFEELYSRFEEPIDRNRWDSPLFTVFPEDSFIKTFGNSIIDAIILRKPPPPNLSTIVKPSTESNYVYEMDKVTQDIINAILEAQKGGWNGGEIVVPKTVLNVKVPSKGVTLSELRRLRRQYQNLNKAHVQLNLEKFAEGFAHYLNSNIS